MVSISAIGMTKYFYILYLETTKEVNSKKKQNVNILLIMLKQGGM